ncbi:MAG: hypothetical protein Q7T34_01785 [Candidatus Parcubacteria bacterium]|nr:hypothetical protein [Candidatus Parcubacteria bacterium]
MVLIKGKTEEEKTLEELEGQREGLEVIKRSIGKAIEKQKGIIATTKGEVVRYKKDLKCEHHPNATFVKTDKIGSGFGNNSFKYKCKECLREASKGKRKSHKISVAYGCDNCGFVKGEYDSRPYKSSPESWTALAGREGTHFHCRICGSLLGDSYYLYS